MSDIINCPLVDSSSLFSIEWDGVSTYTRSSTPPITVKRTGGAGTAGKRCAAYFDISDLAGRTVEQITLNWKVTELITAGISTTLFFVQLTDPIETDDSTLYGLIDPTALEYQSVSSPTVGAKSLVLNEDGVTALQDFIDNPLTYFPVGIVYNNAIGTRELELADVAGDLDDWYLQVLVESVPLPAGVSLGGGRGSRP